MYEHIKVIVSGDSIEVYEIEKAPYKPDFTPGNDEYNALDITTDEEETKKRNEELREKRAEKEIEKIDRKKERRGQTIRDARNKIKRLAQANFKAFDSHFITLTVADNEDNVKKYDNEFKKAIKRMRYKYGEFKYIAVREFQARGAIHYHMIASISNKQFLIPAVPNGWDGNKRKKLVKLYDDKVLKPLERELAEVWGHGFVDVQPIAHVDNVGAYLIKYMNKEFADFRLEGCKLYLNSKGLEHPMEYKGEEAEAIIQAYGLGTQIKKAFTNSYESEYLGKITYKEYNLKRPDGKLQKEGKTQRKRSHDKVAAK